MGLWLQMTACFKDAVNYFESKSKALREKRVSILLTFSVLERINHSFNLFVILPVRHQLRKQHEPLHIVLHVHNDWMNAWQWSFDCGRTCLGFENGFKMVNWSSVGFIEELSLVPCFLNPLTQRHTPGIGSGYCLAPRLAGQDLVLHRPLIPCMATYLTEGTGPSTPSQPWKITALSPLHAFPFSLFSLPPSPKWWFNSLRMLRGFCGALACWDLWA